MAVPGNAYVVQTGGNFTAPASPAVVALTAATAKTVLALTSGTANQPAMTELGVSADGASGTLLIELGFLTAASAGTTTANAPQQIRGWPAQSSQNSAGFNYTAEPTVYSVIARQWLVNMPAQPLIVQFPLGREPTGIVTAATAGKAIGLRLTASVGCNARAYFEYEE